MSSTLAFLNDSYAFYRQPFTENGPISQYASCSLPTEPTNENAKNFLLLDHTNLKIYSASYNNLDTLTFGDIFEIVICDTFNISTLNYIGKGSFPTCTLSLLYSSSGKLSEEDNTRVYLTGENGDTGYNVAFKNKYLSVPPSGNLEGLSFYIQSSATGSIAEVHTIQQDIGYDDYGTMQKEAVYDEAILDGHVIRYYYPETQLNSNFDGYYSIDDEIPSASSGRYSTFDIIPPEFNLTEVEPTNQALNFFNSELKTLWQRLISATDKVCGISSSGNWEVILTSGEKDSNCYPYVEDNMLYSNGDPWEMEEVDKGTVWSFYPGTPLDISNFDTSGNYHIYSSGSTGDYRLVYQSDDSNTRSIGIKSIHDQLINNFGGLDRTKTENLTPADYMKGIAVAARYYVQQTVDTTSRHNLSQIVYMLENRAMPDLECDHLNGNIAYTQNSDGITHVCVCGDCDAIWYESCNAVYDDTKPGYCVCGRYLSDMPTVYNCPVCGKPFTSEEEALNCDDTDKCPANNPGWGHVCTICGDDHYESDCPNASYCETHGYYSNEYALCPDCQSGSWTCQYCGWTIEEGMGTCQNPDCPGPQ